MGIKPTQYKISSMLKKRVLDTAVNEINEKTDITITYELERTARKLTAINLTVENKRISNFSENDWTSIEKKLKAFWIKEKQINSLLKNHGSEYLLANLAIVEEQLQKGKITNATGYLLKAFQNDYRPVETEKSKQQKLKEESVKKDQEKVEKAIKADKAKRKKFESYKKKLIEERLDQFPADEYEELFISFNEAIQDNPMFSKMYQAKWFDSSVIQIRWFKFLEPKLLSEEECDFENFEE